MPDAKQTATKLIQYLVIGYALLSLLYTARYFYTNNSYQQDHTTNLTRPPTPPPQPQRKEQVEAQAQELELEPISSSSSNADKAIVTWHGSQIHHE
ncbi:unnamed protein product [Absidia cylindrospora]